MGVEGMSEKYNDNSIKALKGAERVRKRPGVMFGSNDIKGAFHTVIEILANSLDEARAGYGKRIVVTYHADDSISVLDEGRGVPMGWNEEEQRYNWDLIFNELYAGGKYDEDNEDYEFSLGLNGLGAAATQYTSEWFNVTSWRHDNIYKKSFVKGEPTSEPLSVEPNTTGKTGTLIHWKIDNEVFPDTKFTPKMFKDLLESQAHLNAVDLVFIDEHTGEEVTYHGEGIEVYLKEQLGDSVVDMLVRKSEKTGVENGKKYKAKGEFVLAITEETKSKQLHFHNTATMRTGVHGVAFDDAVTTFFKDIAKQNGVNIIPYDYQDYLSVLTSTYSNITSFANQTKDGVSNQFIYDLIYSNVLDMLQEAYAMQKESMMTLVNNVVTAALARKRAKEIEAQERMIAKTLNNKKVKVEKLIDCELTDPDVCELFIVEGDSAKAVCVAARDENFQAVLPVRGKPINALKAPLDKVLNNQRVQDIINAIGAGVSTEDVSMFDISKCRYSKIIITTDADVDGQQIRVLLYTIFYRLMPELLKAGRVYVALTPLYTLKTSAGEMFAYDVNEYEQLLEKCRREGITIKSVKRSKGLGSNNADMLNKTTMNPETRRIVQLDIDIKNQLVRDISNMLFGEDPSKERKEFILKLLDEKLGEDYSVADLVDTIAGLESDQEEDEDEEVAV